MTEVWNVDCGTTVYSVHSGRVGLVSELTSRGAPTTAVARRELDHRPWPVERAPETIRVSHRKILRAAEALINVKGHLRVANS